MARELKADRDAKGPVAQTILERMPRYIGMSKYVVADNVLQGSITPGRTLEVLKAMEQAGTMRRRRSTEWERVA